MAVDHLDLSIGRGEFFGLLGPNGAGKTTTVRMISTLTPKSAGSITMNGQSIDRDKTALKRMIGVVPQRSNLESELTARENLDVHGRVYGMPTPVRRARIAELLDLIQLSDRADEVVKSFSGGMRQKMMIVRGMMHQPALLLLDEPSAGLDAGVRRKIWDLLRSLKAQGVTVLLTTHYIEEAEALCDRVGLMDQGRLVRCGTPAELIATVGAFVVDYFDGEHTQTAFFDSRAEAGAFAAETIGAATIRSANLEDVFLDLTNRQVSP